MCADRLSEKDLMDLENKLQDLHINLSDEIKYHSRQLQKPVNTNFIDAISENEDNDITQIESLMEEDQLCKVEKALQRISEHTYGRCCKCSVNIPVERLKIIPYAEYCVKCEEKLENK